MKRLLVPTRLAGIVTAIAAIALLALVSSASGAPPTPPFTECPAVGFDSSCAVLIEVTKSGELQSFSDSTQGPFDGIEDTLIGVQNNSSSTVTSIALKTGELSIPIFAFDGDGLCSGVNSGGGAGFRPPPEGCPFGPTGYEGPHTSFSITTENEGSVNFGEGTIASGKSAYFSLEGPVQFVCKEGKCEGGGEVAKETTTTTSLSGGGQSGEKVTVSEGTAVTDQAALSGSNASKAEGTVEYNVYSDSECTRPVTAAGAAKVTNGEMPASESETFYIPGSYYWQASYSGDAKNKPSKSACGTEVETVTGLGGNFVIGDESDAVGTSVTFWGAKWWKLNSLSGGNAPASFKGFEDIPAQPGCGVNWSGDPGNSSPPPAGPLPKRMAVIVSSKISKSGNTISGNTVHIVVVETNPGYESNPGHAGTGTVISQIC
jgi:hypothetical protein